MVDGLRDDFKELQETLVQVRIEIAQLNTKMDAIRDLSKSVQDHETRITSTESSTKSAHKRLDTIDDNTKWLWRTIGAVFIVGVVNAVVQYMANGGGQ